MANHSASYRKKRNKISRDRKKKRKRYYWENIKDPTERAKAKSEFDARLITFNRKDHPATKFKNVVDYAEAQKEFLNPSWKSRLKKSHP